MKRLIYIFITSTSSLLFLSAQQSNYQITQYTIEDGIPSNECHDLVQDSLGYIWIATDRGLSRFDGYGFKNYGPNEGLDNISCLRLYQDAQWNIWIHTYGNKLYKYIPKIDSIVPWQYNHLIQGQIRNTKDMCLDSSGWYHFSFLTRGFYLATSINLLKNNIGAVNSLRPTYNTEDEIFTSFETQKDIDHFIPSLNSINSGMINESRSSIMAFKGGEDHIVISSRKYQYFIEQNKLKTIVNDERIRDLLLLLNNNIVTAHLNNQGVRIYPNWHHLKSKQFKYILPKVSATNLLTDQEGNIYVTTYDSGFIILKETNITNISEYSTDNISSIEQWKKDSLLLVLNQENLVVVSENNYKYSTKPLYLNLTINHTSYYPKQDLLLIPHQSISKYFINNKLNPFYKLEKGFIRTVPAKNARLLRNGLVLLTYHHGFLLYDNLHELPIINKSIGAFDVGELYKDSTLILGNAQGLFLFKENLLVALDSIHSIFGHRITDIVYQDSSFFVATLGRGLVIWDGQNNVQIINKHNDGIVSDNIEHIVVTDNNEVVLCTFSGLSKISFSNKIDYNVTNYTPQHGLPSSDVYDVVVREDTMYVATGKGLSIIRGDKKNPVTIHPIIEDITINNISRPELKQSYSSSSRRLDYNENNITIHYRTLDLSMEGNILYQYNLNNADWTDSRTTFVNFSSLSPDNYTFQVRSANRDGQWSLPISLQFVISPPWWQTKVFYALNAIIIGLVSYVIYNYNIKRIQLRHDTRQEISKLERSALQAQMNPHFIFNCLNSIQNFIIDNEKDLAMDYLSRFATLIRQNLNASVNDRQPLDVEISMIKTYMDLERLRFKNSFNYQIEISKDIDTTNIYIPPLLIQPYVENAILHGMKQKKNDGLIKIMFSKNNDNLYISIYDNGSGIKAKSNKKRKSLGMSITQKRLTLLNSNQFDGLDINQKSDSTGTEIRVCIKL